MRQVYLKKVIRTEASTPTLYTKDDQVEPGKILVLRTLAITWSGFEATESAHFYIQNGTGKIFIGEDLPAITGGFAFWTGKALVGEGDYVGAYTPDSASADVIELDIVGELWDLKDWKKGTE